MCVGEWYTHVLVCVFFLSFSLSIVHCGVHVYMYVSLQQYIIHVHVLYFNQAIIMVQKIYVHVHVHVHA